MDLFDSKGMMIFPSPIRKEIKESEKVLVINECYCPNGHNLVNSRVSFNGFHGIMLKVKCKDKSGFIALSPIYGDKSKISLDIDLIKDELLEIKCPICDEQLPVYSQCTCGADLITLFSTNNKDYGNCIGVCSRVDCFNAEIKTQGELLANSMIDAL
ncbi:MAG: hypothetical protein V1720_04590 [bacterium]